MSKEEYFATAIRILEEAVNYGRFTKKEFERLDLVITWLKEPSEEVLFEFEASCRNGGELYSYFISCDGWQFLMEDICHAYDPNVGGDTYSTFRFSSTPDGSELNGDLLSFEEHAIQVIRSFGEDGLNIELSIRQIDENDELL